MVAPSSLPGAALVLSDTRAPKRSGGRTHRSRRKHPLGFTITVLAQLEDLAQSILLDTCLAPSEIRHP